MKRQLMQYGWLIAISICTGVAGQTALKLGTTQSGKIGGETGLSSLFTLIFGSPLILLGLVFYGIGALAWIAVLSKIDLSLAYPFLALNFVLVALVSYVALGESIPAGRWLGIGVICVGILLIARSTG